MAGHLIVTQNNRIPHVRTPAMLLETPIRNQRFVICEALLTVGGRGAMWTIVQVQSHFKAPVGIFVMRPFEGSEKEGLT